MGKREKPVMLDAEVFRSHLWPNVGTRTGDLWGLECCLVVKFCDFLSCTLSVRRSINKHSMAVISSTAVSIHPLLLPPAEKIRRDKYSGVKTKHQNTQNVRNILTLNGTRYFSLFHFELQ